jgi:hypothetical protein
MTDTTVNTAPSPDAIRASFHAAHAALIAAPKSEDVEGLHDWSEATADYLGKLHDQLNSLQSVVVSQAITISTLQSQMAAVLDGVAELGGDAMASAPESAAAVEADPATPAESAPVAEAVQAAPAEVETAASAQVEAEPEAAPAEPAAAEPATAEAAPADAPAAG